MVEHLEPWSNERVRALLRAPETSRLEFKRAVHLKGQDKVPRQNEFAKDVMSLANQAGVDCAAAHLVIGVEDKLVDGIRPVTGIPDGTVLTGAQLQDLVNERCKPRLQLRCDDVVVDGRTIVICTIFASEFVHVFRENLRCGTVAWTANQAPIRIGESIRAGTEEELEHRRKQKQKWFEAPRPVEATQVRSLLEHVITSANQNCQAATQRTLDAIFLMPDGRERQRRYGKWEPSARIRPEDSPPDGQQESEAWNDVVESLHDQGATVVLGDPGSGKSLRLLREVETRARDALRHLDGGGPLYEVKLALFVPAPILAGWVHETNDMPLCVIADEWLKRHHVTDPHPMRRFVLDAMASGRFLLVVDGLDEVPANLQSVLLRLLASVRAIPCGEILLSSRRTSYRSTGLADCSEWELLPFGPNELDTSLRIWIEDSRLLQAIKEMRRTAPTLLELLTNPLMMMLACAAWTQQLRQRAALDVARFSRRSELFDQMAHALTLRWGERLRQTAPLPAENEAVLVQLFEYVAFRLWQTDAAGAGIGLVDLKSIVDGAPLPKALGRKSLIEDLCAFGAVIVEGTSAEKQRLFFLHRTLLEFFAARWFARAHGQNAVELDTLIDGERADVVLWMVAGQLQNPQALVRRLIERISTSKGRAFQLQTALVHCGFEVEALPPQLWNAVWDQTTWMLDSAQRRRRHNEWKDLAERTLIFEALSTVERVLGSWSQGAETWQLVMEARRHDRRALDAFLHQLDAIADSESPVVRWTFVWLSAHLLHQPRDRNQSRRSDAGLTRHLHDEHGAVRAIAFRALGDLDGKTAVDVLVPLLDVPDDATAAAAAIGLGRSARREGIDALVASLNASNSFQGAREAVALARIGALESAVDRARRQQVAALKGQAVGEEYSWILADGRITDALARALSSPSARLQQTAASGLGKMRLTSMWQHLVRLAESTTETGVRDSCLYACDQICADLEPEHWPTAASFLAGELQRGDDICGSRRSAASGLERLARRGHRISFSVLASGVRGIDRLVSHTCLLAMTRHRDDVTKRKVATLVSGIDRSLQLDICQLVRDQPSSHGLELVLHIAQSRPSERFLTAALGAVGAAAAKLKRWELDYEPDYDADTPLIRRLVAFLVKHVEAEDTKVALSAGIALTKLIDLAEQLGALSRAAVATILRTSQSRIQNAADANPDLWRHLTRRLR